MAIARLSMKVGASGKAGPHAAYIAGAEILRIQAFQQRRADQKRWESLSLADLRLEEAQLRPVPVDTLMQRRPEFLALFDRHHKAEQDRAAADALLAKHTPAYERWQSQHPMQAWLHRRGLWRDKHVDQVEALMEQQKQRKAAAEATIALTQTEVGALSLAQVLCLRRLQSFGSPDSIRSAASSAQRRASA